MINRIFSAAAVLGLLLAIVSSGGAQTCFTQTSGSWEYAGYWTSGVPTSGTSAYVGGAGGYTATLTQTGDAASSLWLGYNSGSYVGPGTVNVPGGTSLAVTGALYAGGQNNGTLSITNGGTVNCGNLYLVGNNGNISGAPGVGYVTVDGSGSTLTDTGTWSQLCYNSNAVGVMQISNGAAFNDPSGPVVIGDYPGDFAYINVLNGGSWNQGASTNAFFNYNGNGAQGFGILDGSGSTWTANRIVLSKGSGGGTFQISNGATANFSNASGSPVSNGGGGYGNFYVLAGGTANFNSDNLNIAPASSATAVVGGSGALLQIYNGAALTVGSGSNNGTLYIANGGTVNVQSQSISTASNGTLSIDVGCGSALNVTNGASLSNGGAVRVVCGTNPAAGNTYTPIHVGGLAWAPSGTVQAVGGTYNGSGTFTASAVVTGTSGSSPTLNTATGSDQDRATWTSNGNTLGASFVDNTGTYTPTVTALSSPAPGLTLASNQAVLGDWQLSGPSATSSTPIYLSLSATNSGYDDFQVWAYNGTAWSQVVGASTAALSSSSSPGTYTADTVANDLAFDGTSYNFSLTGALAPLGFFGSSSPNGGTYGNIGGLSGGLNFNGYDYAVVGTETQVHHPGQVIVADPVVDINDLTIVLSNFGKTGQTWSQGSMDGDPTGTVDVNDLTLVLANFGTTYSAAGGPALGAVPEPASLLLASAGLAGLLACAWRRRR